MTEIYHARRPQKGESETSRLRGSIEPFDDEMNGQVPLLFPDAGFIVVLVPVRWAQSSLGLLLVYESKSSCVPVLSGVGLSACHRQSLIGMVKIG